MSFSFNFQVPDDQESCKSYQTVKIDDSVGEKEGTEPDDQSLKPAEEIIFTYLTTSPKECAQNLLLQSGQELYYIHTADDAQEIIESGVKETTPSTSLSSDLVPNVYEGGLKTWECSIDLVQYLSSLAIAWRGLKVLEVGCGSGLPALYSYTQGSCVTFTDYNREVLENVTVQNVILNTKDEDLPSLDKTCHFWAGDWSLVQDQIEDRFDIILTSETIYNCDNYQKLYNILKKLLGDEGKVYIAAKTYYFGVGGGTRSFEEFVRSKEEFEINVVKVFEEGLQREILLMGKR